MNNNLDEVFQSLRQDIAATVRPLALAEIARRAHRRRAQHVLVSASSAIAVIGIGVGTWAAQADRSPSRVVVPVASPPASASASAPASGAPQTSTSASSQALGPVGSTPTTTTETINGAMGYLQSRTNVPLRAPTAVSDTWGKGGLLSATARATESTYEVDLYRCAPPLPLNDPGVGNLGCGGNAQFYGFFSGRTEASAAAAQAALPSVVQAAPTAVTCSANDATPASTSVALSASITATALSCPGSSNPVAVKWTQQGWSMIDNFGPGGVQDWQLAARNLANHVAAHPLPAGPGLFEVLLAGDGNHAELGWTVGTTIYLVYNDHSEIDAADLAAAMTAHH